jgi:hypothetical protein
VLFGGGHGFDKAFHGSPFFSPVAFRTGSLRMRWVSAAPLYKQLPAGLSTDLWSAAGSLSPCYRISGNGFDRSQKRTPEQHPFRQEVCCFQGLLTHRHDTPERETVQCVKSSFSRGGVPRNPSADLPGASPEGIYF